MWFLNYIWASFWFFLYILVCLYLANILIYWFGYFFNIYLKKQNKKMFFWGMLFFRLEMDCFFGIYDLITWILGFYIR